MKWSVRALKFSTVHLDAFIASRYFHYHLQDPTDCMDCIGLDWIGLDGNPGAIGDLCLIFPVYLVNLLNWAPVIFISCCMKFDLCFKSMVWLCWPSQWHCPSIRGNHTMSWRRLTIFQLSVGCHHLWPWKQLPLDGWVKFAHSIPLFNDMSFSLGTTSPCWKCSAVL